MESAIVQQGTCGQKRKRGPQPTCNLYQQAGGWHVDVRATCEDENEAQQLRSTWEQRLLLAAALEVHFHGEFSISSKVSYDPAMEQFVSAGGATLAFSAVVQSKPMGNLVRHLVDQIPEAGGMETQAGAAGAGSTGTHALVPNSSQAPGNWPGPTNVHGGRDSNRHAAVMHVPTPQPAYQHSPHTPHTHRRPHPSHHTPADSAATPLRASTQHAATPQRPAASEGRRSRGIAAPPASAAHTEHPADVLFDTSAAGAPPAAPALAPAPGGSPHTHGRCLRPQAAPLEPAEAAAAAENSEEVVVVYEPAAAAPAPPPADAAVQLPSAGPPSESRQTRRWTRAAAAEANPGGPRATAQAAGETSPAPARAAHPRRTAASAPGAVPPPSNDPEVAIIEVFKPREITVHERARNRINLLKSQADLVDQVLAAAGSSSKTLPRTAVVLTPGRGPSNREAVNCIRLLRRPKNCALTDVKSRWTQDMNYVHLVYQKGSSTWELRYSARLPKALPQPTGARPTTRRTATPAASLPYHLRSHPEASLRGPPRPPPPDPAGRPGLRSRSKLEPGPPRKPDDPRGPVPTVLCARMRAHKRSAPQDDAETRNLPAVSVGTETKCKDQKTRVTRSTAEPTAKKHKAAAAGPPCAAVPAVSAPVAVARKAVSQVTRAVSHVTRGVRKGERKHAARVRGARDSGRSKPREDVCFLPLNRVQQANYTRRLAAALESVQSRGPVEVYTAGQVVFHKDVDGEAPEATGIPLPSEEGARVFKTLGCDCQMSSLRVHQVCRAPGRPDTTQHTQVFSAHLRCHGAKSGAHCPAGEQYLASLATLQCWSQNMDDVTLRYEGDGAWALIYTSNGTGTAPGDTMKCSNAVEASVQEAREDRPCTDAAPSQERAKVATGNTTGNRVSTASVDKRVTRQGAIAVAIQDHQEAFRDRGRVAEPAAAVPPHAEAATRRCRGQAALSESAVGALEALALAHDPDHKRRVKYCVPEPDTVVLDKHVPGKGRDSRDKLLKLGLAEGLTIAAAMHRDATQPFLQFCEMHVFQNGVRMLQTSSAGLHCKVDRPSETKVQYRFSIVGVHNVPLQGVVHQQIIYKGKGLWHWRLQTEVAEEAPRPRKGKPRKQARLQGAQEAVRQVREEGGAAADAQDAIAEDMNTSAAAPQVAWHADSEVAPAGGAAAHREGCDGVGLAEEVHCEATRGAAWQAGLHSPPAGNAAAAEDEDGQQCQVAAECEAEDVVAPEGAYSAFPVAEGCQQAACEHTPEAEPAAAHVHERDIYPQDGVAARADAGEAAGGPWCAAEAAEGAAGEDEGEALPPGPMQSIVLPLRGKLPIGTFDYDEAQLEKASSDDIGAALALMGV